MTPEFQAATGPSRVSILARVVPALSYALPALGAAVSGFLLISVLRAMRNAESAGIAAVSRGLAETNLAIVVTLYLAIFLGLIGVIIGLVRMFTTVTTASPSGWYFLIAGIIGLLPMMFLWQGQSLLLNAIFSHSVGVVDVASRTTIFSLVAIALGLLSVLVLLASAFVPLPRVLRAKRKWSPFVILLLMQTAIILMTILYHLRTAWLYGESVKD